MDIKLLQSVVAELAEKIIGARIAKIHQPTEHLFVFRLWTGQQNLKLLISVSPRESRIHLTEKSFPNPFTPPRFCQLLRSRLSRITGVELVNEDRIVRLNCLGPKGESDLLIELTGKSSNLILVAADGKIIDSLNRKAGGSSRSLLAGEIYSYPEKVVSNSKVKTTDELEILAEKGGSAAVEKFYSVIQPTVNTTDLKRRLLKLLAKERKKLERRLKKIEQEQNCQQNFEHYRQLGDLLLANMHLLKKGLHEIVVDNYYRQPLVKEVIVLNPRLSPQQNVDKYFQKFKKAKRGVEHSARRVAETTAELDWLAEIDYQLATAIEPADISLVADELKRAGLLKEVSSRLPRVNAVKRMLFKEALSPNGFKVLWGANCRQNDALSTRILKKGDLWLHAHRCPGSHVILKADSSLGQFDAADIIFAASVAAAHSRAKEELKVEVMVVTAKDVKKIPGSKPGMVTVQKYKTLMVEPFADNQGVF